MKEERTLWLQLGLMAIGWLSFIVMCAVLFGQGEHTIDDPTERGMAYIAAAIVIHGILTARKKAE